MRSERGFNVKAVSTPKDPSLSAPRGPQTRSSKQEGGRVSSSGRAFQRVGSGRALPARIIQQAYRARRLARERLTNAGTEASTFALFSFSFSHMLLSDTMYHFLVLESELPHKIVNLILRLGIVNHKLTILWGS